MVHDHARTSSFEDDLIALRAFLRGYFHQDLEDEYGSPEEAVRQFHRDTQPAEFSAVAAQWQQVVESSNVKEINQALERLGSSWIFPDGAALERVTRQFSHQAKRNQ